MAAAQCSGDAQASAAAKASRLGRRGSFPRRASLQFTNCLTLSAHCRERLRANLVLSTRATDQRARPLAFDNAAASGLRAPQSCARSPAAALERTAGGAADAGCASSAQRGDAATAPDAVPPSESCDCVGGPCDSCADQVTNAAVAPTVLTQAPARGAVSSRCLEDGVAGKLIAEDSGLERLPISAVDCVVFEHASFKERNIRTLSDIRVYVKTFGCSHNVADGETMQGVLKAHGFSVVSELADGDVVVVNSCTVKNPSESSALNLATTCRAGGKFVVLAGCVVQADVHNPALAGFSCIGVQQLGQIVEAVLETMKSSVYRCVAQGPNASTLALPHLRRNAQVEIIPISSGCLGNCTYCKTRFARAQLRSFHPAEIVRRVTSAVADGVQQIWLTSEDTGAWGLDIGLNLAHLLYEIDDALVATEPLTDKCVMVRIGMTNPPYILDQLPEICDVLNRKHWFKWIHIPVQSGSNAVLAAMNREYTCEEFLRCCTALREGVRGIVVATDFICGFPGETDAQHAESLSLLENLRLPVVNISQFYPRPGTVAATMKRVPTSTVKLRSREMTQTFASYETFDRYRSTTVPVWIDEVNPRDGSLVGHTAEFVKVLLRDQSDASLLGQHRAVRIVDAAKWHLVGVFA